MSRVEMVRAFACLALAGCDSVLRLDDIPTFDPSPRAVVFDNGSSTVDLQAFPVLVPLDATTIVYALVADPTTDLRFRDETTNTDLPFEVEHWDPTGESDVWVKVPMIHAHATSDRILMYYGSDAHGAANAGAVWSDYDLVFHGDAMVDSTGHATPAMMADVSGAMAAIAPGMIGNGIAFSGGDGQRVEMMHSETTLSNVQRYSIEVCLAPAYQPDPYNLGTYTDGGGGVHPVEPFVMGKPGGAFSGGRLRNTDIGKPSPFYMQTDFFWAGVGALQGAIFYVPDQTWSQVTFSYDGTYLWWYRDGVTLFVNPNPMAAPTPVDTTGENVQLGGTSGASPLLGMLDELRISSVYHDHDWVFAQYLSMTKHFVTIRAP